MIADFRTSLNGPNSIVGRAVVIHEKADDLGKGTNEESRKTGNAGGRIACGIIGVSQDAPVPSVAALDVDSVANTTQSPVEATTDANSTQSENKGTDNQ